MNNIANMVRGIASTLAYDHPKAKTLDAISALGIVIATLISRGNWSHTEKERIVEQFCHMLVAEALLKVQPPIKQ